LETQAEEWASAVSRWAVTPVSSVGGGPRPAGWALGPVSAACPMTAPASMRRVTLVSLRPGGLLGFLRTPRRDRASKAVRRKVKVEYSSRRKGPRSDSFPAGSMILGNCHRVTRATLL